jgi:tetratricopeptide (TPR) repeat protein
MSRANIKKKLKDYAGEKEDYRKILKVDIDSKVPMKNYYRAIAMRNLGDYHGAIKELDDNDLILIYEGLDAGYCHYLLGIWKIEIGQKEDGCLDLSLAGESGYEEAYKAIRQYCQ